MFMGLRTKLAGVVRSAAGSYRAVYRGSDVSDLIASASYTAIVFHHCTGRMPSPSELRVTDAILVAGLDHHFLSSWPARIVMSRAESLQSAIATGVMSIGSRRGAAAGDAALMLQSAVRSAPDTEPATIAATIVESHLGAGTRIPGIGNPVHKTSDPRADGVIGSARAVGLPSRHVEVMEFVSSIASSRLDRPMVINYSGSVGAVGSDLGWDPMLADGMVLLARAGGVLANVLEELSDPTYPEFARQLGESTHLIYEGKNPGAPR